LARVLEHFRFLFFYIFIMRPFALEIVGHACQCMPALRVLGPLV